VAAPGGSTSTAITGAGGRVNTMPASKLFSLPLNILLLAYDTISVGAHTTVLLLPMLLLLLAPTLIPPLMTADATAAATATVITTVVVM
jgi:hypothetical protein